MERQAHGKLKEKRSPCDEQRFSRSAHHTTFVKEHFWIEFRMRGLWSKGTGNF